MSALSMLVAAAPPAFQAAAGAATTETFGREQWLEFAAHLHPVVLHLPIGLFVAAALFELGSLFRERRLRGGRRFLHALLALSAVAAAGTGWLLGRGEDYAGPLVDDHRKLGIALAAVLVVVAALDLFARSGGAAFVRRLLVAAAAVLLLLAGHHGASITHGPDYLVAKAPPWLADLLDGPDAVREDAPLGRAGAPGPDDTPPRAAGAAPGGDGAAPADSGATSAGEPATDLGEGGATLVSLTTASDDAALVLETFAARCFSCHGPTKRKAGLRLDATEGLMSILVPGSPAESEVLRRLTLPRDDDEAMPPKGAPLDDAVIAALTRWIEVGAPLGDVEEDLAAVRAVQDEASARLEDVIASSGARIEAVPEDRDAAVGDQRLSVDWSHVPAVPGGAEFAALGPLAERVHELRLAGREIADADLQALPALPVLRRAHLERTPVGDAGVAALVQRAPGLRYLNLHSTAVSAASVETLASLEELERLVLFGTAVSGTDLAPLTAAHPGLDVTPAPGATPQQEAPEADPFDGRQPRRILAADAGKGRIALLREVAIGEPELLWEHPVQQLHDLQWLGPTDGPHGRVLFQETWTRVVEVDTATDETLWSYDAAAGGEGPVEVHSFRRLADGTTMVAESGRSRLVFLSPEGELVHEFPLTVSRSDVHRDTRLVRETPSGTFLVAHEGDGVAREYDREGNVVWEYRVPLFARERANGHGPEGHGNQLFCALRLDDGDTLITTGNGSSLLRVRPNGSLRWHLGQEDVEGVTLAWTTTIQQLSNGNLVLGNCHAGPENAQILELTPDGERVWAFHDFERFGNALSNSLVLEEAR